MTICIPEDTDWSCYGTEAEIEALDPDKKERSEMLAWSTLAALTGYRIGVCPTVIRPCAARCGFGRGTWMEAVVDQGHTGALPLRTIGMAFTPYITGGNWVNSCGHRAPGECSCESLETVILPGPVGSIESVVLDGEILSTAMYRVDGGNLLVNLDPETPWPTCSPANAAADEGLVVTYYQGMAPNEMSRYAAGILAAEFYKACTGGKCRLPKGVTQVVRNGVTIDVKSGLFLDGDTGIPEVNAVIRILNPNGLKGPNKVLSPDSRVVGAGRSTWATY